MNFYKAVIRPLAFSLDSERVHNLALTAGPLAKYGVLQAGLRSRFEVQDSRLEVDLAGLHFKNPVGLAAGFDKNCDCPELLAGFGFSHLELGTVTAQPQSGNPKPRIFRLSKDQALINRMGFPSLGAEQFAVRLRDIQRSQLGCVLGVNIGKTKLTPLDDALQDYMLTMEQLGGLVDYVTVNVSSPNTPELRKLQEPERLKELLSGLKERSAEGKPLFLKIAPDLDWQELDDILDICLQQEVSAVIATNTTFSRDGLSEALDEQGGLSGPPLQQRACSVVSHITSATKGALPVIGVGGISSAQDVIRFFQAGASLVQVYTGLIYQGPGIVRAINTGLLAYLDQHKLTHVSQIAQHRVQS